jgi:phage tail sheath protein FI
MPANFLHGVETIELRNGARPVNPVKSAVIGLIGIAPLAQGAEKLTLVQNTRDAAQFGIPAQENTIASALKAIFTQGNATVLVVNVFDPGNHASTEDFNYTVTNGKFKITDRVIVDGLVLTDVNTATQLTNNTDYAYDPTTQVVTILNGSSYPDGTVINAEFSALTNDLSDVTPSEIIGLDAAIPTDSTGLKRFKAAFNEFGFSPRIIIAPWFSINASVSTEMVALATQLRAHALLDAPKNATVAECLQGRLNTSGLVKNFLTRSKRAILCYPTVQTYDVFYDEVVSAPLSTFLAGVMANTDFVKGYWKSPSNEEIQGIVGLDRLISWRLNDPQTDANLLNEKGIVTVASGGGVAYRIWGNRSALWDSDSFPDNFICVQRTADIIHESIELAMLPFIDEPITKMVINAIKETGNSFLRRLQRVGAIVGGAVSYDPSKNPPDQIALGQLVFDIEFMPSVPAERITFESFINQQLLNALNVDAA